MNDLVTQVRRVTDLLGEIASATLEQNSGIGLVNNAVTQLDTMTQQNAALVEESAAAASSLREQANQLAQAVATFKLGQQESRKAIAQAQASARDHLAANPAANSPAPSAARPAAAPAPRPAPGAGSKAPPAARGDAGGSRPAPPPPAGKSADDWEEF